MSRMLRRRTVVLSCAMRETHPGFGTRSGVSYSTWLAGGPARAARASRGGRRCGHGRGGQNVPPARRAPRAAARRASPPGMGRVGTTGRPCTGAARQAVAGPRATAEVGRAIGTPHLVPRSPSTRGPANHEIIAFSQPKRPTPTHHLRSLSPLQRLFRLHDCSRRVPVGTFDCVLLSVS